MKTIQKILCLILAFSFLFPIAIIPMSALGESSSRSSSNPEYVLYEEDFDDVTESVTLQAGNNTSGAAKGWIYDKKSTDGSARIENGKMYISGNLYDVIYRDGGQTWGNYTLEADFCYMEDNNQWAACSITFNRERNFKRLESILLPEPQAPMDTTVGGRITIPLSIPLIWRRIPILRSPQTARPSV